MHKQKQAKYYKGFVRIRKCLTALIAGLFFYTGIATGQINMDYYMKQGRKHIVEGQAEKAIPYLNRIISLNDAHYEAFFLRGVAKYELQDYFGAKNDFNKVLKINPFYREAWHYRGIVKSRRHNYYGALSDFNEALQIAPYNPQILINKGIIQLSTDNNASAIKTLNKALKIAPENARAHAFKGRALVQLGQKDSGMMHYNQAINHDPFNYQAFLFRGELHEQNKAYIDALDDFKRAIRIEENSPEAYFKRARVKMKLEDYAGAVNDFSNVLEHAPQSTVTYYNRALAYAEMEAYQKAIDDYSRILEIQPNHPLTRFNRGNIHVQTEQYQKALKDYNKAIEQMPDFEEAYTNRSIVHQQLGNRALAMQDREKARQINNYKRTKAFQRRDTAKLADMIKLEANFNESLSGDKQQIATALQNPEVLTLMPLLVLTQQHAAREFFSTLVNDYNTHEADSLYMHFKDTIKAQQLNYRRGKQGNRQIIRALQEREKLNFNKALAILDSQELQPPLNALEWFARANTHAIMTAFISKLDNQGPSITMQTAASQNARQEVEYDYSPAIASLDKALKASPGFAAGFYNHGIYQARMRQFQKARTSFGKAISLKPDFAEAYFNRAVMHFKLNNTSRGCADLSKAGEKGLEEAYTALKAVCSE